VRHPAEGVLRRVVDEPAGVSDPDHQHVAACARCQRVLGEVRADAGAAAGVLAVAAPAGHGVAGARTDAAWHRLRSAAADGAADGAPRPGAATGSSRAQRSRGWLRRPGVVALGVAVVVAGASTAAASDWLRIFQAESVQPVSFTSTDLVDLPDPSAFGEAVSGEEVRVRTVDSAEAAEAATGIAVPRVAELPRGVTGEPTYQVGEQGSSSFTFSAARAAASAEAAGEDLPPVPAGLDGTTVRLTAGPGVLATWSSSTGLPALAVARGVAPTADSSGAPFGEVRDYLLSLPGLPADVAAQLATFTGDGSTGSTLPLPVPADRATTGTADVDGVPATTVTARDGSTSAVVWTQDGELTAVAGTLSTDELLAVARGLR